MHRAWIAVGLLVVACGKSPATSGDDDQVDASGDTGDDAPPRTFGQRAYIKASNTAAGDNFGTAMALSADGSTLAVGAQFEDSGARGIDGNQNDNTNADAGAVYVFVRSGASWVQQAYLKPSNTNANDQFGTTVALSADGSTLAVGAPFEDSATRGINGNDADNSIVQSGAAYVFTRSNGAWSQQAYIKASNSEFRDFFGTVVVLSADGSTLAVSAFEDSASVGVGGDQADNSAANAGAVYVFGRAGSTWMQQAYVKASNTGASDFFGMSLALAGDGATLAVGAPPEDSGAVGINGNQTDNAASAAGAVYVFARSGATWSQQAYVKASNAYGGTDPQGDAFGVRVALSFDGSTLAAGALDEDSKATGVDGDQSDNSVENSGAAYVFTRTGATWSQQAYIKASNPGFEDGFGFVALSGDGATLVVSATSEGDSPTPSTGALYVFARGATSWTQRALLKASTPGIFDNFGSQLAVSHDGKTIATTAFQEDSAATGIDGDQADDSADAAGAVYVFE